MVDGPYLFHEKGEWVAYKISNDGLEKKSLPLNRMAETFKVSTDNPNESFEVRLKPGLSFELSTYEMPSKLLAIADIEGNFGAFRKLLQSAGVIDKNLKWSFEDGHLVLVGDFFDRGSMVTEVLWLIYKLEWEAFEEGGHVHFILGNHEIMNMQDDFTYVNPKYRTSSEIMDRSLNAFYSDASELGQWLRTKNIVEKIGDHLFVHGGISNPVNGLKYSIEEINSAVRPYLGWVESKGGVVKYLLSSEGPLWYRGYYLGEDDSETVGQTCEVFGVEKIITGHTVVADQISTHYGGRVINIDTPHASGKSEALLIEDGRYYRLNVEAKRTPLFHSKSQGFEQRQRGQ